MSQPNTKELRIRVQVIDEDDVVLQEEVLGTESGAMEAVARAQREMDRLVAQAEQEAEDRELD